MVKIFIIGTQISTHVLDKVKIPMFDNKNSLHREIAELAKRAHEIAPDAYENDAAAKMRLYKIEEEIDRAAARLWGLSDEELADIQRSLRELKGE